MTDTSLIRRHLSGWETSPLGACNAAPWLLLGDLEALIRTAQAGLANGYVRRDQFAIHRSAIVEEGVVLKGAGIIGPRCYVAAGAYLRGGVLLHDDCIIGPSSELKTSVILSGSKLAHLNFVGDSIIGSDVNIEAGAMIANYRNELDDKVIHIEHEGRVIDTGVTKFGALVGDGTRIGANAVIAPGAILAVGSRIGRLQLVDEYPR